MVTQLNQEIELILKKHIGGKAFFDALDMMIRSNVDILRLAMNHLVSNVGIDDNILILTGQFGRIVTERYSALLKKRFCEVYVLPSGISRVSCDSIKRDLKGLIEFHKVWPDLVYYFFDDSYYSGTTRDRIEEVLFEETGHEFRTSIVVYDGSIRYDSTVRSLFRYHPIIEEPLPF